MTTVADFVPKLARCYAELSLECMAKMALALKSRQGGNFSDWHVIVLVEHGSAFLQSRGQDEPTVSGSRPCKELVDVAHRYPEMIGDGARAKIGICAVLNHETPDQTQMIVGERVGIAASESHQQKLNQS